MHPYLIDLGEVALPWIGPVHLALPSYGVLVAVAVVTAWLWMQRRAVADGLSGDDASRAAFWALVGGLAGGKLGLIAVEFGWFVSHPAELLSAEFLQAAGVIWTAVLGGLAGLLICARSSGLPLGRLLDAAAPTLPVAQALGRVGCLLAGCCFGAVCQQPWAIVYLSQAARARTGVPLHVPLHPAPLYEAAWSLLIVLPLTLLAVRRRRVPGEGALIYLACYGFGRFFIEFFRGDGIRGLWFGETLSTSQLLSALVVPAALAAWLLLRRSGSHPLEERDLPAAEAEPR